jgi:hypothetical protein
MCCRPPDVKGQRKVVLIKFSNVIEQAVITSCFKSLGKKSSLLKCSFKNDFQIMRRGRASVRLRVSL